MRGIPINLLERIDQWAVLAPTRLAHVSGARSLTYAELIRRANELAAYLMRELPDDRSPIVVHGHKEPELLIAFLGAVKSRHPYIPLDTSIPAPRVEHIIASANAPLTLTPPRIAELTASAGSDSIPALRAMSEDDPFYIIFTSGSTGEPKGVVITLECLTSFVNWMLAEQQIQAQTEVFLNQAPFSFDLSVMDLYSSLASGGTLFSISSDEITNPVRLYQTLAASDITTWVSTPSFAQVCLSEPTFNAAMLPQARRFLFCGETLAPEVAAQLLERFPNAQVWNTYGPTEATVATTSIQIDRRVLARYAPLPVGRSKPDTRIEIVDENTVPVADGARGEIIIAGPNVSPGYLNNPEQNARAFFSFDGLRAYHTGDAGHFSDGLLFFEGRMDDQIKLHGYRIELGDVEANLAALGGVRDAVVLPILKNNRPDALAAFVILTAHPAQSDFELSLRLRTQLAERLPAYMLPRKFYFLDAFPMTPNGKADRRRLASTIQ